MKWLSFFLLLFVAACQTEARRLLVVDLTLADPLTLETTVAPWHAAGYRVEYRRFYPHLTRSDLARYRTVLVLGGREPQGFSDALTIGDLAILSEWIRGEGVVVLGYGEGDGALDRWIMNRWLLAQGAGIAVGAQPLDVPATPLLHSALDNAGFESFPAGRSHALVVRDRSQTLAHAGGVALVAASRVGDGLILVASRSLLASTNTDPKTRDYLEALARLTRRPAEWASIAAARREAPLRLVNAPSPVAVHPPPLAPPAGSEPTVLPEPAAARREETMPAPGWIARQGMRVLWSRFTLYSLDSLLRFVDAAALNTLATTIPEAALADTLSTRNIWKITGERLQATSIHWFPAVSLRALAAQGSGGAGAGAGAGAGGGGVADEVNRHGALTPIACGLDSLFWRAGLRPAYRALTKLIGARPEIIAGVALDLDSAMTFYTGSGFCDADYRVGLAALGLDSAERERLAALPPVLRYDTLLERGALHRYFDGLETAVAGRATLLRDELRRVHPDLRFAFHARTVPADWFSLGLLRGFSSPEAPVLLWLRERRGRALLQRYEERDIFALSALGLEPERATFAPGEWSRLRYATFSDHAGFWLDGAATDSLGRVIRRFTK